MKALVIAALLMAAALMLVGCTSATVWQDRGDAAQSKLDDYECRREAAHYASGSGLIGAFVAWREPARSGGEPCRT